MTFSTKIKIEISFVATVQLIYVFVFIVWKVEPLKIDSVVPWPL